MDDKRYNQERVLLETSLNGIPIRIVDGQRPMGTGWQRLRQSVDGDEWVPWAPGVEDTLKIVLKLNNALTDSQLNREADTRRLLQLLQEKDDGDMLLTLRSLVDSVEKVVNLLVIVEGWPDLGFLRYARTDLTAALHHAKGQVTAAIEASRSRA